jgi:hypothetical protein
VDGRKGEMMGGFIDVFKDFIYGSCIAAVIMILIVVLNKMGIIDFDIFEWFKSRKERR